VDSGLDLNGRSLVLERQQQRHAESFIAHLEPVQRALESFCRRSLRDRSEVADVMQSALASAFRDFHEFAEGTNFRAWIFRYVSREILNRNRAAGRSQPSGLLMDVAATNAIIDVVGDQEMAMSVLESPERIFESCDERLAEAIREMPPLERSILLLRAIGEFSYREIAEILSVPMGTVMGLLARGRARLREQLADYVRAQGWSQSQEGGAAS